MLRSAVLLLSGNAASSLILLARNLLIARLIPVHDFGVASTLALAMAVVEMLSAFNLAQQMVQAKDGDDPALQSAFQGFQLVRGLLMGLVLFAIAVPFARFMGTEEATWGYQAMALVPVMGGLHHFDPHRLSRHRRFGPLILMGVVPAAITLVAVLPLIAWLGDWRVMLAAILMHAALAVLVSHLVAQRPYRVRLDRDRAAASMRLGWPLLVNAILMYLVFNGDRIIVGRELGMTALAVFSMGVTLTLTPTLVLNKSAYSLFLPPLAAADRSGPDGESRFRRLSLATLQSGLAAGAAVVLATALVAGPFVSLVLGAKYAGLLPYLVPLAVLQGVRVFKAGPSIQAFSRGHSDNAMWANVPRALAVPVGWLLLDSGGTLLQLVWLGVLAEVLGMATSLLLLSRRAGYALRPALPSVAAALLYVLAVGTASLPAYGLPPWSEEAVALLLLPGLALAMGDLWAHVAVRLGRWRPRP